jgi:hypothetical protein
LVIIPYNFALHPVQYHPRHQRGTTWSGTLLDTRRP